MTTETRYIEINSHIPDGEEYDAIGSVIPYRSGNTQLRLLTNNPNTIYQIFINDIENGYVTTDSNGNAIFELHLPLGNIIIELYQEASTNKVTAYLTTKEYSVWHAAIAEQLESIDDSIDNTLKSYRLAEAGSVDIDLAHGVRLLTPNEFNANLETYREILQFMRQAFRQFGGRLSGKQAVIAAITQINPLIFSRTLNAPRWILGFNRLPNNDFQESIRPLDGTDLSTEINVVGDFVTLIEADSYVNTGTGVLTYNKRLKRFIWIPPDINKFIPVLNTPRFYDSPVISADDRYTIPTGRSKAFFDSLYAPSGFTPANGVRLYINIDNRGIFISPIIYGFGTQLVVDAINSHLNSSVHYEQFRRPQTQPSVALSEYLEVIFVSDHTVLNADPYVTTGIGTINSDGFGNLSYQAPTDGSLGTPVTITPGNVSRLYSDNGIEYIDVFVGFDTPPTASDTFIIENRYESPIEKVSSTEKLRINSENDFIDDGPSNIQILDGPFSYHREVFGIDQKYALLQVSVSENDTEVTVPNGTMENFNSVNGVIDTPFDVIIGRGYGQEIGTSTGIDIDLSPSGGTYGYEAYIEGFTGGYIVKKGITHVLFKSLSTNNFRSCMRGIHPVLSINETAQQILIRYDPTNSAGVQEHPDKSSPPTTIYDIFCIATDPSMADEINFTYQAEFDYQAIGTLLRWKPPSATLWGPFISIGSGGYFRLYSNQSDGNKWIDIYVDPSNLGLLPDTSGVGVPIIHQFIETHSTTSDIRIVPWSSGEVATVINVAPSGGNEIWTLKDPIKGNYNIVTGIYEVLPKCKMPPIKSESEDTFGNLVVDVDISEEPSLISSQANIIVGDPRLPVGWVDKSASVQEFVMTPEAKFAKGAILIDDIANDVIFERDVSFRKDQCGFLFVFKVWVRNVAPSGHNLEFKLGFNFGSGLIESAGLPVSDPNDTMQYPQLIEFSQILPPDATQFKVRIRRTTGGSGAERAIIERAALLQEPFDSLYVGDGTIPRSGGRSNFGSLLYVWSPDELSTTEKDILGLDAPSISGLIRNIHNTHEQIDAFDVTDIVSGEVVNVRGSIDEAEWLGATITNLEIISRSPTRFSYLKPIRISKQEDEELQFTQISPYIASLLFDSDQDQDNTILYEDGIPLPNDQWQFNTVSEVEIISGFVPGAIYTIEYQLLTQLETTPIDLDTPPNNGNETWFADYVIWNRHVSDISSIKEVSSIFFNAAFEATLPRRSDQNKLQSILTEDIGTTKRVIPLSAWNYIDSSSIKIDGNQYNPAAIYNLEYNQQLVDPARAIEVLSEIRSANTAFSLSTATYYEFNINDCIDGSKRFHQIRLTFKNITDIRDLRVHSAIVKGLNMLGAGSPPPGF